MLSIAIKLIQFNY